MLKQPDGIDLENLRTMVHSDAWRLFAGRVTAMRDHEARALLLEKDYADIRRQQGAIAALNRVLELPRQIESEIRRREQTDGERAEAFLRR